MSDGEKMPMDQNKPFTLLACDLSLRCPGYAMLRYDPAARTVQQTDKGFMLTRDPKASHGSILTRAFNVFNLIMQSADVLVRERGFSRYARETQAIYKMVGVTDLAAWHCGRKEFEEIAPTTVKKLLTGSGRASKEEVAAALEKYIGKHEYACNDESDAAAVGVAWLIQHDLIER